MQAGGRARCRCSSDGLHAGRRSVLVRCAELHTADHCGRLYDSLRNGGGGALQVQWGITAIMLVSCIGYLGFHFEDRPEELWTLQDSELLEALHYMREIPSWSDSESRALILVFESDSTDGQDNVLTSSFMDSAVALHQHLLSTAADDGTTFYDLCTPLPEALASTNGTMTSAPCFVYSFLEFWPPSIPCMDTPSEILTSQTVRAFAVLPPLLNAQSV